jgi:hypothetical protein
VTDRPSAPAADTADRTPGAHDPADTAITPVEPDDDARVDGDSTAPSAGSTVERQLSAPRRTAPTAAFPSLSSLSCLL